MKRLLIPIFAGCSLLWGGTSPIRQFLAENRIEEAVPLCRQYEVLSTNDTDNFLACAWVYFRSHRVNAGEKILERIKKNASLPEYQLLTIYSIVAKRQPSPEEWKAMKDDERKRSDDSVRIAITEAQKRLEPVVMEQRGTPIGRAALELNAELYELKGQLDPAAFIYKGLVADDPGRARAHWGLGRYYLGRGETQRAISHLEITARLWPQHVGCRFNLGVLYLSLGVETQKDAARWLGEAYRLNKADPGVLEQIGVLFEKKDRLADAIKYWQKAIEINPQTVISREKLDQYYSQVVDDLIKSKKFNEALAKIESGNKTVTSQPDYHRRLGVIYRNLGQYEKAVSELKEYLSGNPEDPQSMRELGIAYLNLKMMDKAMGLFTEAVAKEPSNGMNHAWLAFGYESKRDYGKALDSWKKAADLLKEPLELERATRKIAKIEEQMNKKIKAQKRRRRQMQEFEEEEFDE